MVKQTSAEQRDADLNSILCMHENCVLAIFLEPSF